MRIIFVRHGKTTEKESNWLIRRGRMQAKELAKKLKRFKIDKIYASDLARAKQTAKIVSNELKLPVTLISSLREHRGRILKENKKYWNKEERKQFNELKSFLKEISKKPNKDETILLIDHGNTNRLIISHFLKMSTKKLLFFRQKNSCINMIYWTDKFKNWRLEIMNDYSHLSEKLK
jgi:broad specificity phosphatase PhoE